MGQDVTGCDRSWQDWSGQDRTGQEQEATYLLLRFRARKRGALGTGLHFLSLYCYYYYYYSSSSSFDWYDGSGRYMVRESKGELPDNV